MQMYFIGPLKRYWRTAGKLSHMGHAYATRCVYKYRVQLSVELLCTGLVSVSEYSRRAWRALTPVSRKKSFSTVVHVPLILSASQSTSPCS